MADDLLDQDEVMEGDNLGTSKEETTGDSLSDEETELKSSPLTELEIVEKESTDQEEFSEPAGLRGAFADSGWVDEEAWTAEEVERGAGDESKEEDSVPLGFHIEDASGAKTSLDDDFDALTIDDDLNK